MPDVLLGQVPMPVEVPDGYTIGRFEEATINFLEADDALMKSPAPMTG